MDSHKEIEWLLREIERYFDCTLSEEEEEALRQRLALTDITHPQIEEAKAVMGFRVLRRMEVAPATTKGASTTVNSHAASPQRGFLHANTIRFVAAAVIILVVGIVLNFAIPARHDNRCIAYANGRSLTDEEAVMQLMMENIADLNEGVDEVEQDVSDELEDLLSQQDIIEPQSVPELLPNPKKQDI